MAYLNISAFLDTMSFQNPTCRCPSPSWEVAVPLAERWQLISLYQLFRPFYKGMSFRRVDVNYTDTRILVDASRSVAATIYAVCILYVKDLSVALDCLARAHKQALRSMHNAGVAVIIPYRGDS